MAQRCSVLMVFVSQVADQAFIGRRQAHISRAAGAIPQPIRYCWSMGPPGRAPAFLKFEKVQVDFK